MKVKGRSARGRARGKNTLPKKPPDPIAGQKRKAGDPAGTSKKKKQNTPDEDGSSSDASMSNSIYSILTDDDEGDDIPTNDRKEKRKQQQAKKETPPPPIVVHNLNLQAIKAKLSELNLCETKYRIQLTQFGTKLFVDSNELYRAVKEAFTAQRVNFFTFALNDEKSDKFVLYGLPYIPDVEIKGALESHKLTPTAVKQMNIKQKRYDDHCLYLICFSKKDDTTLTQLQQIRGLLGYVVKWKRFQSPTDNITQCGNCLSLGHGSRSCGMPTSCLKCSGPHSGSQCPHNDPLTGRVPDSVKVQTLRPKSHC